MAEDRDSAAPSCPDEATLDRYINDELAPDDDARVAEHIDACSACQEHLDRRRGGLPVGLAPLLSGRVDGGDDVPPRVDAYDVVGQLGAGGMGVVWRVHEHKCSRFVALKVMKWQFLGEPNLETRFLNEARICGRLDHPNIVAVHDQGRLADGRPYYVMKLVKGKTLGEVLHGRATPDEGLAGWLKVFADACHAVAHAHEEGVIHRDLTPANLMLGRHGEVQVMDWGVAKNLGDDEPAAGPPAAGSGREARRDGVIRTTDELLGTLHYMAPEQARGQADEVDRRADVFSLGAILCTILTGAPPYTARERDVLIRQVREGDLTEAFERLRGCGADAELTRLAMRCLSPAKERRPADAGEVAAAVDEYLMAVAKKAEGRRRRYLLLAMAASVLLAGSLAWNDIPRWWFEPGPNTLQIGLWPYPAYAPLVVAARMGLCDGLDLRIVKVADIKEARVEMLAGHINASTCVVDSHVHTRDQNVKAKAVLRLAPSVGADGIVAKEGIRRLTDLHGKRVAYVEEEPPHFLLLALAEKAGAEGFVMKKVDWLPTTAEDAKRFYVAGKDDDGNRVDAAITWEPHLSKAKREGGGNIIASSANLPDTIVDILTVEEGYLNKRPNNVTRLIRGWFRAVEILKPGNPRRDEAIGYICKEFGMTREEYEALAPLSPCSSVQENVAFFDTRDANQNRFRVLMSEAQKRWNELRNPTIKLNVDPVKADGSEIFLGMKEEFARRHNRSR
jgi:serine/threonine protein kinase